MFRKLKFMAVGLFDRRHLYRIADALVQEIARRLDAYYDVGESYADNPTHSAYFKVYKFKAGTVQLRYHEDGESLVELAVFISHGCVYPPPEKGLTCTTLVTGKAIGSRYTMSNCFGAQSLKLLSGVSIMGNKGVRANHLVVAYKCCQVISQPLA